MQRRTSVLSLLIFLPATLWAQQPADVTARLDRLFERWNSKDAPGCVVAVSRTGQPLLTRAYGMADLEHDVPNTRQTVFEAGSVSKQFTAAAIVLLALEGKLSLEDNIRKYLPEIPDYGTPVTIRHMLTHTSGLRDWGSVAGISGWPRTRRAHTHAHVVDILSRQRGLNFPPGAEYSYSNSGYNLLAVIVDRVSGTPFAEFSKKRIFEPLGMTNTQWRDDFERIVKGRAVGYNMRGDGYANSMPFEYVHGNGGLLTTVSDLLIWTENLNTGNKLGGKAFVDEMHRQGILSNGQRISYASGLMVGEYNGTREVSHTGSTAGYRAYLARYPDKGMASAVLCNAGNANPGTIGNDIAAIFLGTPATRAVASQPQPVTLTPQQLAARAGLYRHFRRPGRLEITVGERGLRVGNTELIPVSAEKFQAISSERRIEFIPGSGPRARVRDISADADTVYWEPVEAFKPDAAKLAEFAGSYYSPDVETTFRVTVENGSLVLHRRPNTRIALTPVFTDAFNGGQLGQIRFLRDAGGKVTELSIGESRVYDLRATRQ
jgi:CubicO group peptidase (beta-lactamase class C family)